MKTHTIVALVWAGASIFTVGLLIGTYCGVADEEARAIKANVGGYNYATGAFEYKCQHEASSERVSK